MKAEEVKIGKSVSYVRANGKYFRREFNQYTGGVSLSEIIFDENGIANVKTSSQCYCTLKKENIDILFLTDGRTIEK